MECEKMNHIAFVIQNREKEVIIMERIAWDQYFMAQSQLLALRSTCTRLMVGATIVRDKRIIAGGYNGSVSGDVHCIDEGCYVIDGHCVRTVHAEANALLQCAKFGVPTDGADVYVTHFPCLQCTKQLIQSGIKNLFYAEDYKNHPYAIQLFEEAGVKTQKVPLVDAMVDTNFVEKNAFVYKLMEKLDSSSLSSSERAEIQADADRLFLMKAKSIERLLAFPCYSRGNRHFISIAGYKMASPSFRSMAFMAEASEKT